MRISDLHKRVIAQKTPLLLDIFPNASVSYSLRKLRTNYNGACIRVRRSSDNAEQDIGFVNNELDTASLLLFTGSGSGFVKTWYDQSLNAFNATNTTNSQQPRIVVSGAIDISSLKPSLRWINGSFQRLLSTFSVIPQPISVFSVAQLSQATGIDASVLYDSNSSSGFLYYSRGNSETPNNVWRTSAPSGVDLTVTTSNVNLFFNLYNGNASSAYINNSIIGSGNFGTGSLTGLTIGNLRNNLVPSYDWSGWISELIIYGSDQFLNRQMIQNNINNYYNIY
jgi:hypothetical protein